MKNRFSDFVRQLLTAYQMDFTETSSAKPDLLGKTEFAVRDGSGRTTFAITLEREPDGRLRGSVAEHHSGSAGPDVSSYYFAEDEIATSAAAGPTSRDIFMRKLSDTVFVNLGGRYSKTDTLADSIRTLQEVSPDESPVLIADAIAQHTSAFVASRIAETLDGHRPAPRL